MTIKTSVSSCSLLSHGSFLNQQSEDMPLSPPLLNDEDDIWHEMKISKRDIKKGKKIGGGCSSSVYIGKMKSTGKTVALKVIDRIIDSSLVVQVFNEMKGLSNLTTNGYYSHPGIVTFYGAYLNSGTVVLCLEYMDGGSLQNAIDSLGLLQEVPLAGMIYQICLGLNFIHNVRKVLHRDIKPENILFNSQGEVKLADFGVSRDFLESKNDNCSQTYIGTFRFMSPERMTGKKYSFPSDMWSLGIVLFCAATGSYPFSPSSKFHIIEEVCEADDPPTLPPNSFEIAYSTEMRQFVSSALKLDHSERITAQNTLKHSWFKKHKITDLNSAIAKVSQCMCK